MQVLGSLRVFKVACAAVLGLCLVVGIGSQGVSAVAAGATAIRTGAVLPEGALTGACGGEGESVASDRETTASGRDCVGGAFRRTRGRLSHDCLTGAKALVPGATYVPGECSAASGLQAEAIAHARAVAWLNLHNPYGSPAVGGIAPAIQWETYVGATPTLGGLKPDIMVQSPTDAEGQVGLIEVKVERPYGAYAQSYAEAVALARSDVDSYVTAFDGADPSRRDAAPYLMTGFADSFFIQVALCRPAADGTRSARGWDYTATSPFPGTVVASAKYRRCNTYQDDEEQAEEEGNGEVGNGEVGKGFKGSARDLIRKLREAGVKGAEELLERAAIRAMTNITIELTQRQLTQLINQLNVASRAIDVRLANESAEVRLQAYAANGVRELENMLALESEHARLLASESRVAATRGAATYATERGVTQEVAEKVASTAFREAADARVSQYAAWRATELGEAAVKRIAPRLTAMMERLLAKTLTRAVLGRAVIFIPYVGQAIFAAWLVYDTATLIWDLMKIVGWGDPHLVTLDGLTYDLQSAGEFTMLRARDPDFEVQARFTAWNDTTSITQGLAVRAGETNLQILSTGALIIAGEPIVLDDGGMEPMEDGSTVSRTGNNYLIASADGRVVVGYDPANYQVRMSVAPGVVTEGLLGDNDGVATNDVRTSNGEQLPARVAQQVLHGRYADSWRVTDASSAFYYDDDESTATYTDKSFPTNVVTIGDFPAIEIEAASQACRSKGVADGPQFDDCVYDVLVMGDASYATAAAAVKGELIDPHAVSFDADGVLDEDFVSPVAANFAFPSYLDDPATSRVAGPIFDTPGYSFYALDAPRHHRLELTLDLIAYGAVETDSATQSVDVKIDDHAPISVPLEGDQAATSTEDAATLARVRSGETAAGTPFTVYRLTALAEHIGSSLKIVLAPHGFRGVLGTSLGVDRARVQLATTPADSFDVSLPFGVGAGSISPGPGAGSLETASAQDDYHFTVDSERDLVLDVDGCFAPQVALVSLTSGEQIAADRPGCGDRVFADVPAGDYVLKVWVAGGPRDYAFGLLDGPAPQRFDYQLGQTVSDGSIGDTATPGAGNLETAASLDVYDLTVTEPGTWLFLGEGGSCANSRVVPVGGGASLGSICGQRQIALAAGDYRIEVPGAGGGPTGAYSFESLPMSDGAEVPVSIPLDGKPVRAALGAQQNASFNVTASGGERVRVWLDSFSGDYYVPNYWGGGVTMRVFAPDGTKVFETGNAAPGWQWVVESAQAGVYRVVVDPHDNEAGTVTLRAKDVSDRQVEIPLDGSATAVALDRQENASFNVTASGGERVRVWLDSFSGDYYVPNYWGGGVTMRVFAPDGTKVFETGNAAPGWQWVVESAQAGVYRVVVDPHDNEAGTVTLRAKAVVVTTRNAKFEDDGNGVARVYSEVSLDSGRVPTSDEVVPGMTVTVPAATSERTALVDFSVLFTGDHTNRFALWLDGQRVNPADNAPGVTANVAGGNNIFDASLAAVPLSLSAGTEHVIELRWQASDSTSAVTLLNRSLVAHVIPNGDLARPGVVIAEEDTPFRTGSVPTSDEVVPGMTVTVPAATSERTALVDFSVLFTGDHTNRFALWLDGQRVNPADNAPGVTANVAGGNNIFDASLAAVPLSLSAGTEHVIELRWQASDSTSAVTLLNRSLVVQTASPSAGPTSE